MLNGARQVGKTWLLHEFARTEYKKEAYVVCRKNDLVRQLFSQDFNVERILRGLRAITSVDITPGDTLIILDEVQDVPEILESLKYFQEEAPEYHISVAGSLLGISLHSGISFPVGKINVINIFPLNFEEFLMAKGENEACKLLANHDFDSINALHEKYTDLLRQYYYVGECPRPCLNMSKRGHYRKSGTYSSKYCKATTSISQSTPHENKFHEYAWCGTASRRNYSKRIKNSYTGHCAKAQGQTTLNSQYNGLSTVDLYTKCHGAPNPNCLLPFTKTCRHSNYICSTWG